VTTMSTNVSHIWGSCGYAGSGMEVKILRRKEEKGSSGSYEEVERVKTFKDIPEEKQGEICFRGRHIMLGYMANPLLGEEHVKLIKEKKQCCD